MRKWSVPQMVPIKLYVTFFALIGLAHGWMGVCWREQGTKMSQSLVRTEVKSETEAQANGVLQNQGTGKTNSS